jgi:hypothetical protein
MNIDLGIFSVTNLNIQVEHQENKKRGKELLARQEGS